jgi:hypothetical protein
LVKSNATATANTTAKGRAKGKAKAKSKAESTLGSIGVNCVSPLDLGMERGEGGSGDLAIGRSGDRKGKIGKARLAAKC